MKCQRKNDLQESSRKTVQKQSRTGGRVDEQTDGRADGRRKGKVKQRPSRQADGRTGGRTRLSVCHCALGGRRVKGKSCNTGQLFSLLVKVAPCLQMNFRMTAVSPSNDSHNRKVM